MRSHFLRAVLALALAVAGAPFAAWGQACVDGVPASMTLTPATAADAVIDSVVWGDRRVTVKDAAGNLLRNIRVAFTVPPASPSGTFYASGQKRTVITTGPNCFDALMPDLVADGVAGSFTVWIEAESNPSISNGFLVRTAAADPAAGVLGRYWSDFTFRAATGKRFAGQLYATVGTGSGFPVSVCCGWAGVAITVTTPALGASATFPDGSHSATVVTDAAGRALVPALTANEVQGPYTLTAYAAPRTPVELATLTNVARSSVATITSDSLQYRAEFPFKHAAFPATVTFPDSTCSDALHNGPLFPAVSLTVNGHLWYTPAEASPADTRRPLTCPVSVQFKLSTDVLPFGRNELRFAYAGDDIFDPSAAAPIVIDVDPQASGNLATGAGTWRAGAMYHEFAPFGCRLTQARSLALSGAGSPPVAPPGQSFPFGFFSYEIAGCTDSFAGLAHRIVIELDQDIPAGATAWAYVATQAQGAPSWVQLGATLEGKSAQIVVEDDGAGDDPATGPRLLRGIVGIAVPQATGLMNVGGAWWGGPSQNGWGMGLAQHGTRLVATLFVYDDAGNPRWLIVPGGTWSADARTFTGSIYRPSMIWASGSLVAGAPVGTATLAFADAGNMRFSFTIDGVAGTRTLVRQVFASPTPLLRWSHTDLWWYGVAKAGFGISLTELGDSIFSVVYSYDGSGATQWRVMPGGQWQSPTSFRGRMYDTKGSAWLAGLYDPAKLNAFSIQLWGYDFESTTRGKEYAGSWREGNDFGGPSTSAVEREDF